MNEQGGSPYAIPRISLGMKPYIFIPLLGVIIYSLWESDAVETVTAPVDVPPIEHSASLETMVGHCAECHGETGADSSGEEPYLAGQNIDYLVFAMRTYTMGIRHHADMEAAISGITLKDVKQLAAYYASQDLAWQGDGVGVEAFPEFSATDDPLVGGERLARSQCASCHGLPVQAGVPKLNGLAFEYLLGAMSEYQSQQRPHVIMGEAVSGFSIYELEQLSFYYANQSPESAAELPARAAGVPERVTSCNGCHGDDGNSRKKSVPSLAGQDRDYFIRAMQSYQQGERKSEKMARAVASLSEPEITALADYYAGLPHQPVRVRQFKKPKKLAKACNTCHGYNGHSQNPSRPAISGQVEGYIVNALRQYQHGERDNNAMRKITQTLSQLELLAIADFYANQD